MKANYNSINDLKKVIKYYQNNKQEFFINCLGSDENERQYLYDDWIEDFFLSSYNEQLKQKQL